MLGPTEQVIADFAALNSEGAACTPNGKEAADIGDHHNCEAMNQTLPSVLIRH